jgi:hypothetical protein
MSQGDKTMTAEGTWKQEGSSVVFTPKTMDGKPLSGAKAEPQSFRFENGVLSHEEKFSGLADEVAVTYRRK